MKSGVAGRGPVAWTVAGLAILFVAMAFLLSSSADIIRWLGRGVPQPNLERDYMVAIVWAAVLGAGILWWPVSLSDKKGLLVLWGAKCLVTLGFMLLYEWNYIASLDAYGYFQAGRGPGFSMRELGIGNSFNNIALLAWVQHQVLPDSYHALKVSFSMVGLAAIYIIYRATVLYLGREDIRLLFFVGLFPSVLFWSSIIGKDPVQLFGIALYLYGTVGLVRTTNWRYAPWIAMGVGISVLIRVWTGPILLFPLLVFAWTAMRGTWQRIAVLALASGAIVIASAPVIDYFKFETAQDILTAAELRSSGWAGGSSVDTPASFDSFGSLLAYAPIGAFTALFRPLPGELLSPFGLMASAESVFLLGLTLSALRGTFAKLRDPIVQWALLLILTWSVVYGYASYNLGAVVRFRLQILPVLLLTLLYLSRPRPATAPTVL